jgi:hypothetical protein
VRRARPPLASELLRPSFDLLLHTVGELVDQLRLELLPDLLARGQRGLGLVAQFLAHTASNARERSAIQRLRFSQRRH